MDSTDVLQTIHEMMERQTGGQGGVLTRIKNYNTDRQTI